MTKRKKDRAIDLIEKEVVDLLKKPTLTPVERIRAIEVWSKVLMIRHKLEDGGEVDGAFFGGKRK